MVMLGPGEFLSRLEQSAAPVKHIHVSTRQPAHKGAVSTKPKAVIEEAEAHPCQRRSGPPSSGCVSVSGQDVVVPLSLVEQRDADATLEGDGLA